MLVYKESGCTSFDVVARLRRLCQQKSVGHTGTLDPLAEGLLVVALGKALRTVEYMESHDKGYLAVVSFGMSTDTYDAEGQPVAYGNAALVTAEKLRGVLPTFSGAISQTPPVYSALKRNGRKLCDLARQGQKINLEARPVFIQAISLLDFKDNQAVLEISCSKGTYIRSLAHDLGQALGCPAHLTALTRTFCGPFRAEEAHTLTMLKEAAAESSLERFVLPIDSGMGDITAVVLSDKAVHHLKNGRSVLYQTDQLMNGQKVRVYGCGLPLIAVCLWHQDKQVLVPVKVFL